MIKIVVSPPLGVMQVSNKLLASREGEEGQPAAGKAEDVAPVEEKGSECSGGGRALGQGNM